MQSHLAVSDLKKDFLAVQYGDWDKANGDDADGIGQRRQMGRGNLRETKVEIILAQFHTLDSSVHMDRG